MLGVIFPKELAVDLVLHSLLKLCSQFVKEYYMTDYDVTLIYLIYLLIAAEAAMLWRTGQANLFGGSISQCSMNVGDGNGDSPEMVSPPKGEKSDKVKKFGHKNKDSSEVVPCANAKEYVCFYCQLRGDWKRSCPDYLRVLKIVKSSCMNLLQVYPYPTLLSSYL